MPILGCNAFFCTQRTRPLLSESRGSARTAQQLQGWPGVWELAGMLAIHLVGTGLMGQHNAVRVEGVVAGVVQHVGQAGGVDVGEAGQAAEEVGRVVVGAEQASKVGVEHSLGEQSGERV